MTEKEKMLRGMLYDADDSTLCADRVRAKELCHAYNQLRPSDAAGMRELLQRLLGETGETFCVTAPFWCDYGYNIRLGEHFYANHNLVILICVLRSSCHAAARYLSQQVCLSASVIGRMTLHGLPTATESLGMSLTTTLPPPITTLLPIVTPGMTCTPPPIHT